MKKGDRKPNCGVCGELKVERRDRLVCQKCQRNYQINRYHLLPKKPLSDIQKKAKYKNRKKIRVSGLSNQKVYAMKARYGISEEVFIDIFINKQNHCCAICAKELEIKETCIDHCHLTNKIIGVLCRKCNFAIGLLEDSVIGFRNAIKYLSNN